MTTAFPIYLNTIELVKEFESTIGNMEGKYELCMGHYIVDAKSIFGILSMDLTRPMQLRIAGASEQSVERLRQYCRQAA